MEEKYKVFGGGFNKILDLVEDVDETLAAKYKRFIKSVPPIIQYKTSTCDDFAINTEVYMADMMRLVNEVSLDYIRKNNYLRSEVVIHRLFVENLERGESMTLFTFTQRNCPRKPNDLLLFYEEGQSGKLKFVGTNDDKNCEDLDVFNEVYLEKRDFEYFLVSRTVLRGVEIYRREVEVSFDALLQYVEDEEEFEEDWTVDFDPDFDL